MSTSSLQKRVSELLSTHLAKFTIRENIRPDWLLGLNGERLELDFLIEELNAAIEVQGRQHYSFIEFFHGDENGFHDQLVRDRVKRELCRKNSVKLYEVANESDAIVVITEICDSVEISSVEVVNACNKLKAEIAEISSSMASMKMQFETTHEYMKIYLLEKSRALASMKSILESRNIPDTGDSPAIAMYELIKSLHKNGRVLYTADEWAIIDKAQSSLRSILVNV